MSRWLSSLGASFFLSDFVAEASTNGKSPAMWTGDGPQATGVFTAKVSF